MSMKSNVLNVSQKGLDPSIIHTKLLYSLVMYIDFESREI